MGMIQLPAVLTAMAPELMVIVTMMVMMLRIPRMIVATVETA